MSKHDGKPTCIRGHILAEVGFYTIRQSNGPNIKRCKPCVAIRAAEYHRLKMEQRGKLVGAKTRPAGLLYDPVDAAFVEARSWSETRRKGTSYAVGWIDGKLQRLHRIILNAPSHLQVDHINGNGLDNRRCNLRLVDNATNQQNRVRKNRNNTSGKPNIHFHKALGLWVAEVWKYGKRTRRCSKDRKVVEAALKDIK